ncbi:MAG: phage/plasmid primase, P4 family [Candidatus Thermoplasmatota archaeon]|nr:phage/plasmid primase, P4 family [Candidatus Thermoplasmatota archaeon]
MTENKENILGSNISSQGNSVGEFIFSYPIKTEADFFQFRAWCNQNKIFGVERELTALEYVKISANMIDFLQTFYADQGSLNEFDQKALLEFIRKRQKSGRQKKVTNSDNDERPTTTEIAVQLIQSGIFRTFRDNESVYYYRDGVYVRNGETKIKEMVHEILEGEESSQFCSEVIGKVQRATYTDRSEFTEHSEHKIVVNNGILDLDTLALHGHTPEWLSLTKFPVNFKKETKCHKISRFINEIARPEDIPLLQEWVGYNLWIFGYPAQKSMLLVGDGGNGKSTFIGIIESLVGKENRSAVSLHELEENRFAKHDLYGKAANLYPDLPDKDLKSTGIFKMLTGGDPIRAEDKNVRAFTYHNVAKLTFSCNAVPRVPEDSVAYFRRWLIVEFPYSFEGSNNEDKDLKEKLINDPEEMSGFLNWALEGLQRLRVNGWHFSNGKTVETVKEDYIVRSDPYKAFVMHCIDQGSDAFVVKQDLYENYRKHCAMHKVVARSQESFFKNFRYNFPQGALQDEIRILDSDGRSQRKRGFKGIKIRSETDWCIKKDREEGNISAEDFPSQGDHGV